METRVTANHQIPDHRIEAMDIPLPQSLVHKMEGYTLSLLLEPGIKAIHHVDIIWWIEQLKVRIEPSWSTIPGPPVHSWQMASMRSIDQDHRRIHSILKNLASDPLPHYPSMDSMKILIWNCRRAGNNIFKRNLRELLNIHKPEILVFMETKVPFSSLGNFFNNLGFSASTVVDPVGKIGGIWMLWDTAHVNVRTSSVSNQYIQATIHREDYEEWIFSAVYASPNPVNRDTLWEDLERTAANMNQPWLVAGDFNDFTDLSERRSFSPNHTSTRNQRFRNKVNNCNLIDLGSIGPRLTWTNNR
ncbi:hypothetical protein LOK49_LG07G03709 [Camellia lanceoleosa]|uniref:Uncharacterized protein n=1 Tax=Camellia lanceoleosa TaxID=1840588 RepID=A0ACC0H3P4_9ERIC|nr:hypothetical protein LOK49_LG07G03709 [Camellia lanceoleosa]